MKRLIALFAFAMMTLPTLAKGDWKGKVVDENGDPVPYANVAVLPKPILPWFAVPLPPMTGPST